MFDLIAIHLMIVYLLLIINYELGRKIERNGLWYQYNVGKILISGRKREYTSRIIYAIAQVLFVHLIWGVSEFYTLIFDNLSNTYQELLHVLFYNVGIVVWGTIILSYVMLIMMQVMVLMRGNGNQTSPPTKSISIRKYHIWGISWLMATILLQDLFYMGGILSAVLVIPRAINISDISLRNLNTDVEND
ncbi:MAG: hypothetical protein INQ03_04750 [Candidatus Heimdallarchaeota archaeon]|nr:hypothetical protein [Candidatus Heimdallarchaeota archaeon]